MIPTHENEFQAQASAVEKSPLWGQKSKSSKVCGYHIVVWPMETCARSAEGQWKKIQLNRTYQYWEKAQKLREDINEKNTIGDGGSTAL